MIRFFLPGLVVGLVLGSMLGLYVGTRSGSVKLPTVDPGSGPPGGAATSADRAREGEPPAEEQPAPEQPKDRPSEGAPPTP